MTTVEATKSRSGALVQSVRSSSWGARIAVALTAVLLVLLIVQAGPAPPEFPSQPGLGGTVRGPCPERQVLELGGAHRGCPHGGLAGPVDRAGGARPRAVPLAAGHRGNERGHHRAHRARLHAGLRDHRADQLRPRRQLHDRLLRGFDRPCGHVLRPGALFPDHRRLRSEEHTSELQSRQYLVCRLLLEKKKNSISYTITGYIH